jgi:WD40 repeat protein
VEVPTCPEGVAFSDDSKQFATQDDESVSVWDLASQRLTFRIDDPGPLDRGSIAFSPGGALLAIARKDSVLRLWDLKTGELRQTIGDDNSVHLFAFRPDGKLLVTGHECRIVRVWQAG